jgi:CBS domain-containing protein
MTEQVVLLEEREVIGSAMEAMQRGKFRHLPVVAKSGRLVGIVSDRNILRHLPGPRRAGVGKEQGFRSDLFRVAADHPSLGTPLKQIMVSQVMHVSPSCGIFHAAAKMFDLRISSLVVLDEDKGIRGVVTVTDFMRMLLALYEFSARPSPM